MKFIITNNTLTIKDLETINSGSLKNYEADVITDESWEGLSIVAKIFNEKENIVIERAVIDGKVYIDIDTLKRYSIGFIGYTVENGVKVYQKSTNLKIIPYTKGAGELRNPGEQELPTATEWEIYLNQVQEFINNANEIIDNAENITEEMNEALENVNTAITETNNLDLDVNKVNKTTTVSLTKKNGTTKNVQIEDGLNLEFMWQGTSLGIRVEGQENYVFVNLQGIQGPVGPQGEAFQIKKTYLSVAEMNADFNNMNLGDYVMIASEVETEDNAKLYTRGETQWIFISDFSGAQGIRGPVGLTPNIQIGTVVSGETPNVTRSGTDENPVLNFTLVKGDKGNTGKKGDTGNGIATVIKTGTSGLVDTYTITFTDGNTTTFEITNGEDGEVTQAQFDDLQEQVEDLQNNSLKGTASGTSIDLSDSADSRVTNIDSNGNSKQETPTYKGIMKVPKSLSRTINGLTFIVNDDGSVKVEGTSTSDTNIDVELENPIVLNGTYTFSLKTVGIAPANSQQWILRKQDTTTTGLNPTIQSDTTNKVTKENLDTTAYILRIFTGANKTFNCTVYPILEEGDTATDWDEAEIHNTPNSDYEQPIKSCGEDINLFDKDNANIIDCLINDTTHIIGNFNGAKTLYLPIIGGYAYTVSKKVSARFVVGSCSNIPANNVSCSNTYQANTAKSIKLQTDTNDNYLVVFYYLNGTDTLTEQEILDSIKIQKGSIATPWSPYGMGSISEKITNKNYYKLEDIQEKTQNEVTYSIKDGVIKLNGTATGGFNIFLNSQYSLKAGNYTMSAKVLNGSYSGGVIGKYVQDLDTSTQIIDGGLIDRTVHRTITQDYLKCRSYFYIGSGASFNNFEVLVQLEAGETASEAIPNQEQVYAIPTQQPMRSVGDVRDIFDIENKLEKHYIKRVIFDGTEDWYYPAGRFVLTVADMFNYTDTSRHSTVLSNKYLANISGNNNTIFQYTNQIFIYDNRFDNKTDFVTNLAEQYANGTPVYVDYILATPLDLPCTQEQKKALEAYSKARTYKNITHIYSEDEVEAVVDLTYVKDLETVINSIINS